MKDVRKPSTAMVEKLLKAQGMKLKLNKFIRESAYTLCLPYLSPVESEEEKRRFIEDNLSEEVAIMAFTQVYSKYFSVNELLDILSFYKSPTGQKLCQVQDKVGMEVMVAAQQIVQRIILKAMKHGLKKSLDKLEEIDFTDLENKDNFEELT